MENISKITLPNDITYNIRDKNARNFTNTPYYKQDEEALMFQLGESYMTEEQDNQPYLFRAAGGSADIGNREYDKIIGGTVAWNQLLENAKFSYKFPTDATVQYDSTTDSVSYSATIGTQGWGFVGKAPFNVKKDNIYLLQFDVEATNVTYVWGKVDNVGNTPASHQYANGTHAFIQKSSRSINSSSVLLGISVKNETSVTATFSKSQVFDLTQMFGTTIADYIYSLETATPGAGVAWFRKLFPKPYYEYNPGELISVSGLQSHDMVGFNVCGSMLEYGNINNRGNNDGSSTTYVRTKDYIQVIPGATYCFYASTPQQFMQLYCLEYDAAKNFIARNSVLSGSVLYTTRYDTFTLNANTYYIRVFIYKSSAFTTTDGINICINLSGNGERDGEYEEYKMHSYPLDSSLILRGIPKLDANNQLYYDGDTYEADGTVTRKYGIVDLGTLNWALNTNSVYRAIITDARKLTNVPTITNAPYTFIPNNVTAYNKIYKIVAGAFALDLYFRNDDVASLSEFVETVNGRYLVYELETPTTETAEPYDNPQIVAPEGTEEYITTSIVPVGHETKY